MAPEIQTTTSVGTPLDDTLGSWLYCNQQQQQDEQRLLLKQSGCGSAASPYSRHSTPEVLADFFGIPPMLNLNLRSEQETRQILLQQKANSFRIPKTIMITRTISTDDDDDVSCDSDCNEEEGNGSLFPDDEGSCIDNEEDDYDDDNDENDCQEDEDEDDDEEGPAKWHDAIYRRNSLPDRPASFALLDMVCQEHELQERRSKCASQLETLYETRKSQVLELFQREWILSVDIEDE